MTGPEHGILVVRGTLSGGLSYTVRVDPTDNSVIVELSAPLDLPLTVPGSPSRPTVSATGSAVVDPER